jgi:hypothetical protein
MLESKTTAERNDTPIQTTEAVKILNEYELILEEIEMMLATELIAVHLVREKKQYDPAMIFEMAMGLLERKRNRTIREDAILAYAKKRLRELEEVL